MWFSFVILQVLIDYGADIEKTIWHGRHPLHTAGMYNSIKVATVKSMMSCRKHLECLQLLIESGADVEAHNSNAELPLHDATAWYAEEVAKVTRPVQTHPTLKCV